MVGSRVGQGPASDSKEHHPSPAPTLSHRGMKTSPEDPDAVCSAHQSPSVRISLVLEKFISLLHGASPPPPYLLELKFIG